MGKNLDPHLAHADTDEKKAAVVEKYLRRKGLTAKFMGWVDVESDRTVEGVGIFNNRGFKLAHVLKIEGEEAKIARKQEIDPDGTIMTYIAAPIKQLIESAYEQPLAADGPMEGPTFRVLHHPQLKFVKDEL